MRKRILILALAVSMVLAAAGCGSQADGTVKYEGEKYACLEYPQDLFYYDYNGNSHDNFAEADGIYQIDSQQWDMIWNGGDLYCIKKQIDDAVSYYADDENYDWYAMIDSEDDIEDTGYPVDITKAEIKDVYAIKDKENTLSVFVDEFEKMGSIVKISKDGVVRGTISIGKYNGSWYWRSEVIDESRETDGTWPEYVQPLPLSLDGKIKAVE